MISPPLPPEALEPIAIAAALAWAAGLRFYGVVFFVGAAASLGWINLPGNLQVLTHPAVIAVSGFLFLVEFLADKVPIADSAWDAINTFVRVPGGALLAGLAMADNDAGLVVAAALLGGVVSGGTHLAKSGTRAAINLSPEPLSNWVASFSEDGIAAGILLLAVMHPLLLLVGLMVFVLALLWLLPKLFRLAAAAIRQGFQRVHLGRP